MTYQTIYFLRLRFNDRYEQYGIFRIPKILHKIGITSKEEEERLDKIGSVFNCEVTPIITRKCFVAVWLEKLIKKGFKKERHTDTGLKEGGGYTEIKDYRLYEVWAIVLLVFLLPLYEKLGIAFIALTVAMMGLFYLEIPLPEFTELVPIALVELIEKLYLEYS